MLEYGRSPKAIVHPMPGMNRSQTRAVFVTSTFRDMNSERDFLRDRVLPELLERLRPRRRRLELIDLRWGVETASIEEENAKQLLVLKVCLGAVARCRPFIIAVLGDRYGWIPPAHRALAAAREVGFPFEVESRSLTELEIEFGALGLEGPVEPWFYFRRPLPYAEMGADAARFADAWDPTLGPEERAYLTGRLEALKTRIRHRFPRRVRDYSATWDPSRRAVRGLEAFGAAVLEDLWGALDGEPAVTATPEDAESLELRRYLGSFAGCFVGRSAVLAEATRIALSRDDDTRIGVLTGPAGQGKSALFSHLCADLEGQDAVVLSHAAGMGPLSRQVLPMLTRWVRQLSASTGMAASDEEIQTEDGAALAFRRLLSRQCATRRVVVLLDGLDEFERTAWAAETGWLPRIWPDNARLLATGAPCAATAALGRRPRARLLPLEDLSVADAAAIARHVCDRYHREMSPAVLEDLLASVRSDGSLACGNPLWTTLAADLLNLLDADDFERADREFEGPAERRLVDLMRRVVRELPPDLEALHVYVTRRSEKLHGAKLTRGLLSLLAASRGGWRDSDLASLLPRVTGDPWNRLEFEALKRTLAAYVAPRGRHEQLHLVATALPRTFHRLEPGEWKPIHAAIAEHLEVLPAEDPVRRSEVLYHMVLADDRPRSAKYFAGIFDREESDLATHTVASVLIEESQCSPVSSSGFETVESLLTQPLDPDARRRIAWRFVVGLDPLLEERAPLVLRERLLRSAVAQLRALPDQDPRSVFSRHGQGAALSKLAHIEYARGDVVSGLMTWRAQQPFLEELARVAPEHWNQALVDYWTWLGEILLENGDSAGALDAAREGVRFTEGVARRSPDDIDSQESLGVSLSVLAAVLLDKGDTLRAIENAERGAEILRRITDAPKGKPIWLQHASTVLNRLGDAYMRAGRVQPALEASQRALGTARRLAESDPSDLRWLANLAVSLERHGVMLGLAGGSRPALDAQREALQLRERLAELDPDSAERQRELAVSLGWVSRLLLEAGSSSEAVVFSRREVQVCERMVALGRDAIGLQRDLSVAYCRLGDVLLQLGESEEALRVYRRDLELARKLAALDPSNTGWQRDVLISRNKVGDVLKASGNLAAAAQEFRSTADDRRRFLTRDPANAEWRRDLAVSCGKLGDALVGQSLLPEALRYFRESAGHATAVADVDPANVAFQQLCAESHHRVADTELRLGHRDQAIDSFLKAVARYQAGRLRSDRPHGWLSQEALALLGAAECCFALGDARAATLKAQCRAALGQLPRGDFTERLEAALSQLHAPIERRKEPPMASLGMRIKNALFGTGAAAPDARQQPAPRDVGGRVEVSEFFPLGLGLGWTYSIEIDSALSPLYYREVIWPYGGGTIGSAQRGILRVSTRPPGPLHLRVRIEEITNLDGLFGATAARRLSIVQDDLGVFRDHGALFLTTDSEQGFSVTEVATFVADSPMAPYSSGLSPGARAEGRSSRLLFFAARPGTTASRGPEPRETFTFEGPDQGRSAKWGALVLRLRRDVKSLPSTGRDEHLSRAFSDTLWYARGVGLVELEQLVGTTATMRWKLVRSGLNA